MAEWNEDDEILEMDIHEWDAVEWVANVECPRCKKSTNIYCGSVGFVRKDFECEHCRKTFSVYCNF